MEQSLYIQGTRATARLNAKKSKNRLIGGTWVLVASEALVTVVSAASVISTPKSHVST